VNVHFVCVLYVKEIQSGFQYMGYGTDGMWDGIVQYHVVQKVKEQVHKVRVKAILV
jgi:hypothetical protein